MFRVISVIVNGVILVFKVNIEKLGKGRARRWGRRGSIHALRSAGSMDRVIVGIIGIDKAS